MGSSNLNVSYSKLGQNLVPSAIASVMTIALENPNILSLAAGFTDSHSLPVLDVSDAVKSLSERPGSAEYLQYGTNQGRSALRSRVAGRLMTQDGISIDEEDRKRVFITNGSQQALFLATQVLCDTGDIVFVESPSYFVYLEMLKGEGVEARSLPTRGDGSIDLPALEKELVGIRNAGEIGRVKAVYLVSYFSNPTGESRSEEEKIELAGVLRRIGEPIAVIEDAAYRDLYFTHEHPARSIVSLNAFEGISCLYLTTLTKPFATGLKIGSGFCTDAKWLERILWLKGHHDFGSSNFTQAILEEVLSDDCFDNHLRIIRRIYQEKMNALHAALCDGGLTEVGWSWKEPSGGLYLWLKAPEGLDTRMGSEFWKACCQNGVLYVPGDLCYGGVEVFDNVRLSFGVLEQEKLKEAASRFTETAISFSRIKS